MFNEEYVLIKIKKLKVNVKIDPGYQTVHENHCPHKSLPPFGGHATLIKMIYYIPYSFINAV